jgi:hypothetical protein
MALPETIQVRYTEEEAGYVSLRPVVRQTFRLTELLDMVLSVTGKDPGRVRQILHSGTVVFHFYRYWWQSFDVSSEELALVLATFPDSDPSREFPPESCVKILIEPGGTPPRPAVEFERSAISRSGLLRRRSLWEAILAEANVSAPANHGYSYGHRADLYKLELSPEARKRLADAASLAPRNFRKDLQILVYAARIVFVCPRLKV